MANVCVCVCVYICACIRACMCAKCTGMDKVIKDGYLEFLTHTIAQGAILIKASQTSTPVGAFIIGACQSSTTASM